MSEDRHLDLLEVGEIANLSVEMARDNVAGGIGADDVHVFDDAEVGAVYRQRAREEIADDHVARHVSPLVKCAPQVAFLVRATDNGRSVSSPFTSISCQGISLIQTIGRTDCRSLRRRHNSAFSLCDSQRGDAGQLFG